MCPVARPVAVGAFAFRRAGFVASVAAVLVDDRWLLTDSLAGASRFVAVPLVVAERDRVGDSLVDGRWLLTDSLAGRRLVAVGRFIGR